MESSDQKKRRVRSVIAKLKKEFPDAGTTLVYSNPLELLVATILSAQCTDERVNIVTKSLFKIYRKAEDYAVADINKLEKDIQSTGFFRQKAKSIQNCCKGIVEQFDGNVPDNLDDLVSLVGVGRKTANVVLGSAFGIPGIVVDTHVRRVAGRLGLTENTNPDKIEFDLMEIISKKNWTTFSFLLINHGRKTCSARNPKCGICGIGSDCPSRTKFLT